MPHDSGDYGASWYSVYCDIEICGAGVECFDTAEEALKAWNARYVRGQTGVSAGANVPERGRGTWGTDRSVKGST